MAMFWSLLGVYGMVGWVLLRPNMEMLVAQHWLQAANFGAGHV